MGLLDYKKREGGCMSKAGDKERIFKPKEYLHCNVHTAMEV